MTEKEKQGRARPPLSEETGLHLLAGCRLCICSSSALCRVRYETHKKRMFPLITFIMLLLTGEFL